VTSDGVVGDTETALVMRLMEPHVNPSAVLMVPCLVGVSGALLEEAVADLPIDMLLLEDVLICEVNLPVEVLKVCVCFITAGPITSYNVDPLVSGFGQIYLTVKYI
jgi:hypothetical protein